MKSLKNEVEHILCVCVCVCVCVEVEWEGYQLDAYLFRRSLQSVTNLIVCVGESEMSVIVGVIRDTNTNNIFLQIH